MSETLHAEISPFGLRSTCIDFGYFRTEFLTNDHRAPYVPRIADYKEMSEQSNASLVGESFLFDAQPSSLLTGYPSAYNGKQPGDPKKGVEVVLDVVRGEGLAAGKPFPTSLALGSDCYSIIKVELDKSGARLEEWSEVSKSTDFAQPA